MFYVKELLLTNFRCYKKKSIEFSPSINIIVGDNAVGKTSLVEAIHSLGFLKSHKANSDIEMINNGEEYSIIKARFHKNDVIDDVILSITKKGKRIQRNNKVYSQLSQYVGYFNVVIFCPEDLDLIKGSPLGRRKFLDVNLSQIDSNYLTSFINYRKLLKQRNEILKNINETNKYDYTLLNIVTKELIKEAKYIVEKRKSFIEKLNPYLGIKCYSISEKKEKGRIVYNPNTRSDDLVNKFENNLKNDIFVKTTTCGPHRDDFLVMINDQEASIYGSQGQQRTISLAIKLALADLIKEVSKNVVIILDDVFSELDINRQNQILKLLKNENQIFITTTTVENLSNEIIDKSNLVKLFKEVDENGR